MAKPIKPPLTAPLHHPVYLTLGDYSGDCIGLSILLEVEEGAVRKILEPTPFEFVAPYAWVEAYVYPTTGGMAEYEDKWGPHYGSFGVVVPARYGDVSGGYYAHCFKNKDYGSMIGRDAGFPIKYAELRMQKTGRAITAAMERPTARMELSLVLDEPTAPKTYPKEAIRSPHLLLHTLPSVERDEILLQQIIKRDVAASSDLKSARGEATAIFPPAPSGMDELAWLASARPIYGEHFYGLFRGAFGEILSVRGSERLVSKLKR